MTRFIQKMTGFWMVVWLGLLLAACQQSTPTPTSIPPTSAPMTEMPASSTPTVIPTDTPAPTNTPVPTETPAPTAVPAPQTETTACPFDLPQPRQVRCGTITVPEDRAQPDGNQIVIQYAVFASDSPNPAPDPIVYLEGGPGGDALEALPLVFEERFAPLLAKRDLVMFDQRGTGYSQPSLACPEYTQLVFDTLAENPTPAEEAAQVMAALDECHARLVQEGANLAAYNSAASAADLDDLRRALGYEQWNLLGVSYGTRLALTTMRDFPEGIRSVILDSTYPLQVDLTTETGENFARALRVFLAGCTTNTACATAFPDLRGTLFDLVARLDAQPISVPVTDIFTQKRYEATVNGQDLLGVIFQSLYQTEVIPLLPQLVGDVDAGIYTDLSTLLSSFLAANEFFSIGMQYSVQCHEEIAFSQPITPEPPPDFPELTAFVQESIGTGELAQEVCAMWNAGNAGSIENQPVHSDIPTLILSGEYDPITPPAWGQMAQQDLSHSFFFGFPGMGHGVSLSGDCPREMVLAFVDDPAQSPNDTCIADLGAPAFIVGAGGAQEAITLVPFTVDVYGLATIEGIVPEGWQDLGNGAFGRGQNALDQTALVLQAAPGLNSEALLTLLAGQLGLEDVAQPRDTYDDGARVWSLYGGDVQGLPVDIAVTDDAGYAYVVLLISTPADRDGLYEAVFLPALAALTVQ